MALTEPYTAELIRNLLTLRQRYEREDLRDIVAAVDGTIERLQSRAGQSDSSVGAAAQPTRPQIES